MSRHFERCRSTNAIAATASGVGVVLLLGVGACAGHREVALPTTSARGAPGVPNASPSPASAEDAIRQSYTQYWVVIPQAEHADDEARRRQLLATYTTDPQLTKALRGIDELHSNGMTSTGYVVVHIEKVLMNGDKATLWDCQDATRALIQERRTGKTLGHGGPTDQLRATLVRGSDGQWRISEFGALSHCSGARS